MKKIIKNVSHIYSSDSYVVDYMEGITKGRNKGNTKVTKRKFKKDALPLDVRMWMASSLIGKEEEIKTEAGHLMVGSFKQNGKGELDYVYSYSLKDEDILLFDDMLDSYFVTTRSAILRALKANKDNLDNPWTDENVDTVLKEYKSCKAAMYVLLKFLPDDDIIITNIE